MARVIQTGFTEVVVDRGLANPLLPPAPLRERCLILTQPGATHIADDVATLLSGDSLIVELLTLPDREEAKSLEVVGAIYEALARFGLTRSDAIVTVGGGSVSDVGGFVAGTWLRGVEVAHIPTTLLAAVDAAVGGKAAINFEGKNLVGLYWHPSRVVVDIDVLAQLPTSLIQEGMAEVLKCGLIADRALFELVLQNGLETPLEEAVVRSVEIKAARVKADERDAAERMHLNFGHTIGHAIEFASSLAHGHSVGVGMAAAAAISTHRLGFTEERRVLNALECLNLPSQVRGLDRARILELLGRDKKREGSAVRMVLLSEIGEAQLVPVTVDEIEIGLEAIGL